MRCYRSDWPGLCLFCCSRPTCIVSQQSWFGAFLFPKFYFDPPPPRWTEMTLSFHGWWLSWTLLYRICNSLTPHRSSASLKWGGFLWVYCDSHFYFPISICTLCIDPESDRSAYDIVLLLSHVVSPLNIMYTGVMGCGATEATGLGFVFVVTNPRVKKIWAFFFVP